MDAVRNRHKQHLFAVKPRGFHIAVRRHDDAVGGSDFFGGQHIFRAAAAVGFGFHRDAQLLPGFFQRFRRHIGMGNAGGTGGDRQHPIAGFCGSGGGSRLLGFAVFGALVAVDHRQKRLLIPGGAQVGSERRIHKQYHQMRENFQMHITVQRGGDHEKQVGRHPVHRAVIHAGVQRHCRQTGTLHAVRLGVRHGNAGFDCGAGLRFARQNCLAIGVGVSQRTAFVLQRDQLLDRLLFVGGLRVQRDLTRL